MISRVLLPIQWSKSKHTDPKTDTLYIAYALNNTKHNFTCKPLILFPFIISNSLLNIVKRMESCPRCGCSNTKFCYYNNYSLTQPRYFCKGCRRYWTKGGSLRNVPIGGGCRKNHHRRGKSSSLIRTVAAAAATTTTTDRNSNENAPTIDLALVYANFLNQQPASNGVFGSKDQVLPPLPNEQDMDQWFNTTHLHLMLPSDDPNNLLFPNWPPFDDTF